MEREIDPKPEEKSPYERFRELAGEVLGVPPEEVRKRQIEWQAKKTTRKGRSHPVDSG